MAVVVEVEVSPDVIASVAVALESVPPAVAVAVLPSGFVRIASTLNSVLGSRVVVVVGACFLIFVF